MDGEQQHLVAQVPEAPWLPPGSTAQVWVGRDCVGYEPTIIVRLLVTRSSDEGEQFFTTRSTKGDDLPTLFLGSAGQRLSPDAGLLALLEGTIGRRDATTRCIGFVRNVVASPDESYAHPTPHAHVPVFLVTNDATPTADGSWFTLDTARPTMQERHWWPVIEHYLDGTA